MGERVWSIHEQILGILLAHPERWSEAAETLTADHWPREVHRALWTHLETRVAEGREWTDVGQVVCEAVDVGEDLDRYGGAAYLTSLPEAYVSDEGLPYLVRLAVQARKKLALRDIGLALKEAEGDVDETIAGVEATIAAIRSQGETGWLDAQALGRLGWDDIQGRYQARLEGRPTGWMTGIGRVDALTGGIAPPQYWVLAARPKMGKSALALQWALKLARDGLRVAYFSLELPARTLAHRAIAHLARVPEAEVRDGRLTRTTQEAIQDATSELYGLPLYVDEKRSSPSVWRSKLLSLVRQVGHVDLVVVDYLQLMSRERGDRYGTRAEEVGAASHTIQATLKEVGAAGLVICSLNRSLEARNDKRPLPSDLRESGDIESDCDAMVALYREEVYTGTKLGEVEIIVRLNRHGGKVGTAICRWDDGSQSVREEERRYDEGTTVRQDVGYERR